MQRVEQRCTKRALWPGMLLGPEGLGTRFGVVWCGHAHKHHLVMREHRAWNPLDPACRSCVASRVTHLAGEHERAVPAVGQVQAQAHGLHMHHLHARG